MKEKVNETKEVNIKDIITIDGTKYVKDAFMIEEFHPAIGRMLIFDDVKFKIMDDETGGPHRTGTYISKVTERDEETMQEYDEALEELSSKLVSKIDIKRLIKENMKHKAMQEIKTGLFILKAQEDGKEVTEEHHSGCYDYKIHYKNQSFCFVTGADVMNVRL